MLPVIMSDVGRSASVGQIFDKARSLMMDIFGIPAPF